MERLKSTLGILMWLVVSTVIAYHIGILDQNPMLGTRNFSLCRINAYLLLARALPFICFNYIRYMHNGQGIGKLMGVVR